MDSNPSGADYSNSQTPAYNTRSRSRVHFAHLPALQFHGRPRSSSAGTNVRDTTTDPPVARHPTDPLSSSHRPLESIAVSPAASAVPGLSASTSSSSSAVVSAP